MFEELWDHDDLEWTVNRMRVEILTLKRQQNFHGLFRLYGELAKACAVYGDFQGAQDALNDAEFLVVEHQWRGSGAEAWCFLFRGEVLKRLGHGNHARRNLEKASAMTPTLEGHAEEQEFSDRLDELKELLEIA